MLIKEELDSLLSFFFLKTLQSLKPAVDIKTVLTYSVCADTFWPAQKLHFRTDNSTFSGQNI